jgi:hypothetical protein
MFKNIFIIKKRILFAPARLLEKNIQKGFKNLKIIINNILMLNSEAIFEKINMLIIINLVKVSTSHPGIFISNPMIC